MSREYHDNFYRQYGPNIHTDPVRFKKLAEICKGDILDLACGTGDLADYYKGQYTGIDISEVAVNYATNIRRKTATFYCYDLLKDDVLIQKKFDTIVMAEFLEHIENDYLLFKKIEKWAKPDSRLIISVPNADKVPDKDHKRIFTIPEIRKRYSIFGKVKFYNWPGEKERIIFTIDLGQKNEDLMTLAIIAKNEEKGLEQAVLSAIELVDQVVISVDKNSTDKTLEIAENYADILKQHEWKNDFAAARNFCQEGIKTKWVLWIDGHEYLKYGKEIDKNLKDEFDSYHIRIRLENGFTFWYPRIVRNNVKWKFEVHNAPETKNTGREKAVLIQHDRENLQSKEARQARNEQREKMVLEIMFRDLKKDKKDIRAAFYIAQHYNYTRNFKKAIKFYKKYLKYGKIGQERWLMLYELGKIYNLLGKHKKAIKFFRKAEKELPNRWEIKKRIGATYMLLKKWDKALIYLVDSFGKVKADFVYNPEQENYAQTWFFISQCFFATKRYEEGKIAAQEALKENEQANNELLPENEKKILEAVLNK